MAGKPQCRPDIVDERARRADGGEPLYSDSRLVLESGDSFVVGLTAFGCKVHQIDKGQEVGIEIHADGIWIDIGGQGDE